MSRNNHSHHFDHSLFIMRILLCGALALTYVPVSVHAEDGDTVSDTEPVTQPDDDSSLRNTCAGTIGRGSRTDDGNGSDAFH